MDRFQKKINKLLYFFSILLLLIILFISFNIVRGIGMINQNITGSVVILNASSDELIQGKNFVKFYNYINVKELIRLNPDIETVSYQDEFLNKSVGYVNIFGGIGKDFLIIPQSEYEISIKRTEKLSLN